MDFYNSFRGKQTNNIHKTVWNLVPLKIDDYSGCGAYFSPFLTKNFYISSYSCPYCHRQMHKTVFPPNFEYTIEVNKKNIKIKRAFTCLPCHALFAPKPGDKLNNGFIYTIQYDTYNEYIATLFDMDNKSTTVGRIDI